LHQPDDPEESLRRALAARRSRLIRAGWLRRYRWRWHLPCGAMA